MNRMYTNCAKRVGGIQIEFSQMYPIKLINKEINKTTARIKMQNSE